MKNMFLLILLTAITLFLTACQGGGETAGDPSKATVILQTSGVISGNQALSGIGITISLPSGVVPLLNGLGQLDASVVVPSGVTANAADIVPPHYIPATQNTPATISFVVVSTLDKGFGIGEFSTLNLLVPGKTPVAAGDFKITGFQPADLDVKPVATGSGGLLATISLR